MTRHTGVVSATVVVLACLLAGCGGDQPHVEGSWVLVRGEAPGGRAFVAAPYDVTLEADVHGNRGVLGGQSFCNGYGFRPDYGGGPIAGDGVETTLAGCPGERDDLERQYYDALAEVDHVEVDGDRLVLSGGGARLEYAAAD